jgi:hypothetical protein
MRKCALLVVWLLMPPAMANGFGDWAVAVVAGDSYSEDQKDTAVFDNGRQTIVKELKGIGFAPRNIRQFTDWPQRFHDAVRSTPKHIARGLGEVTRTARAGCLIYLTSHGNEKGIGIGDYMLSPKRLGRLIGSACAKRPAVVIVSACYSGVFVDRLKAPDRIVLTAAAKDRSSFGCGATDQYTYFDTCAIETLPKTGDFISFGKRTIACVAAREKKEKVDLPSNPQLVVGDQAAAVIPHWK